MVSSFMDAPQGNGRVQEGGRFMTLIRILGKDYTFSREAADKLEKTRGICRYDIASLHPLPILYMAAKIRFFANKDGRK